jgi:hypothetical protein
MAADVVRSSPAHDAVPEWLRSLRLYNYFEEIKKLGAREAADLVRFGGSCSPRHSQCTGARHVIHFVPVPATSYVVYWCSPRHSLCTGACHVIHCLPALATSIISLNILVY